MAPTGSIILTVRIASTLRLLRPGCIAGVSEVLAAASAYHLKCRHNAEKLGSSLNTLVCP